MCCRLPGSHIERNTSVQTTAEATALHTKRRTVDEEGMPTGAALTRILRSLVCKNAFGSFPQVAEDSVVVCSSEEEMSWENCVL